MGDDCQELLEGRVLSPPNPIGALSLLEGRGTQGEATHCLPQRPPDRFPGSVLRKPACAHVGKLRAGPGPGATSRAHSARSHSRSRVRLGEVRPLFQPLSPAPWTRFWFSGADRSAFL